MEDDKKIEMDWRQRLRMMWLKESDANMRFLHLMANDRRRWNQILSMLEHMYIW